jgi:hypothetical protein
MPKLVSICIDRLAVSCIAIDEGAASGAAP